MQNELSLFHYKAEMYIFTQLRVVIAVEFRASSTANANDCVGKEIISESITIWNQTESLSYSKKTCGVRAVTNMFLQSWKYQHRYLTPILPSCRTWTIVSSFIPSTSVPIPATPSLPNRWLIHQSFFLWSDMWNIFHCVWSSWLLYCSVFAVSQVVVTMWFPPWRSRLT